MITVYAESSFVLRHARRQDGPATQQVLQAAQEKKIRLVVPVLALFEPLYNWNGRRSMIDERMNKMRELANELERSWRDEKPIQHEAVQSLRETALKRAAVKDEERDAIGNAIDVIESCAEILPIPKGQITRARQSEGLVKGPADALVFTAVMEHASASIQQEPRFFLALDTGFSKAPVDARLRGAGVIPTETTAALIGELQKHGVM